jgi:hypothetical protein
MLIKLSETRCSVWLTSPRDNPPGGRRALEHLPKRRLVLVHRELFEPHLPILFDLRIGRSNLIERGR